MRKIILMLALLLPIDVLAQEVEDENVRDYLLRTGLNSDKPNDHLCERVLQVSRGAVQKEECLVRLGPAKEKCTEIIRQNFPESPSDTQGTQMGKAVILCPVAVLLGYSYDLVEGESKIGPQN